MHINIEWQTLTNTLLQAAKEALRKRKKEKTQKALNFME
jgi:hypothetical protein